MTVENFHEEPTVPLGNSHNIYLDIEWQESTIPLGTVRVTHDATKN